MIVLYLLQEKMPTMSQLMTMLCKHVSRPSSTTSSSNSDSSVQAFEAVSSAQAQPEEQQQHEQ